MMSYEKEVTELWKEWKKSTEKYEEAIEDGYDVDADMWANDVETIHRQIHLYEQAAKADEYEAKAKAWDLLTEDVNFIESEIEEIGLSQMLAVKTIGIKALKRKNEYESGESDAKE